MGRHVHGAIVMLVSPDEKVLCEAERWFRTMLRGPSISLRPHEVALFTAIAERQNSRGNIFVSKDPDVAKPPPTLPGPGPEILTTIRPPPTKMDRLIHKSKRSGEMKK